MWEGSTCNKTLEVWRQRLRRRSQQGPDISHVRGQGAGQLHPEVSSADGEQRPVAAGLRHMLIAPRGVDRPPAQQTATFCCDTRVTSYPVLL